MIMHCALWSDPDLSPSLPNPQPNPRGAGVLFGPDSTMSFLSDNGLDMVVRSHECVEDGFDLPFEDEMEGVASLSISLCLSRMLLVRSCCYHRPLYHGIPYFARMLCVV